MRLTKPITAHGEQITDLPLRAPTAGEIMDLGFPFQVSDGGTVPIAKTVGRYLVKLGDIPLSSVQQISPEDFMTATAEVIGFFGASDQTEKAAPI